MQPLSALIFVLIVTQLLASHSILIVLCHVSYEKPLEQNNDCARALVGLLENNYVKLPNFAFFRER